MKGLIGLILIIIGFTILVKIDDKTNDSCWYTRKYTVLSHNQSEHLYKGNYRPDYYHTIRYLDDPNFNYTVQISGTKYFSENINSTYDARFTKSTYTSYLILLGVIMLIGIVLVSVYMVEGMEIS